MHVDGAAIEEYLVEKKMSSGLADLLSRGDDWNANSYCYLLGIREAFSSPINVINLLEWLVIE